MRTKQLILLAALILVAGDVHAADGLIGHWRLAGDARDSSGAGRHAVNHGVNFLPGEGAVFNGRNAWLEVPTEKLPTLGKGAVSVAAWVHTAKDLDDVLGDVLGWYDPDSRTGMNLTLMNFSGVTSAQSNTRNILFGIDAGRLATRGGDRGAGIVPGQPDKSLLFQALTGNDDLERMPYEKPQLQAAEIALIRAWIVQGGKYPADEVIVGGRRSSEHWSFQPIVRAKLPAVSNPAWVRNAIDTFVLARLDREQLKPAPTADRVTLIRRLSLDLLGLPPSTDQVDAFLADTAPGAYSRLVDRMLASPRYGERWGRHWLALARYADSDGFTIDAARSIWKYRDWVIGAINDDMPFDRFSTEQLAGDLLPAARLDQQVATGFHRNTLINQEGGTDDEQFRVDAVVDRVNTTGATFLGLTVGCARCHAHKFDPISQRDFYQLFAVFNSTEDNNDANAKGPKISVPSPDEAGEQTRLAAAISCTFCMPSAVSMISSKPMRLVALVACSIWVTSMSRA